MGINPKKRNIDGVETFISKHYFYHFMRQSASNDPMFCRILHDEMTQPILRFITNCINTPNHPSNNSLHLHG